MFLALRLFLLLLSLHGDPFFFLAQLQIRFIYFSLTNPLRVIIYRMSNSVDERETVIWYQEIILKIIILC